MCLNFLFNLNVYLCQALKKSIVIVMMSIYGILSVGIHIHAHYCCGKLSTVDFFEPVKHCCSHNEKTHEGISFQKDCCDFELYDFTIDQSHQGSTFQIVFPTLIVEKTMASFTLSDIKSSNKDTHPLSDTGPPITVPLFIKHQSLVLYA